MSKYIMRLDDAAEKMDVAKLRQMEQLFGAEHYNSLEVIRSLW